MLKPVVPLGTSSRQAQTNHFFQLHRPRAGSYIRAWLPWFFLSDCSPLTEHWKGLCELDSDS